MTKRYTLFIAVLFIVFSFSSCLKDGALLDSTTAPAGSGGGTTTVPTSMVYTLNGSAVTYSNCATATASAGAGNSFEIIGFNGSITAPTGSTFEAEVYIGTATVPTAGQVYPAATSIAQTGGSALYYSPNTTDTYITQPAAQSCTVTITAVTAKTISGTFSGKLFATTDLTGTTVLYTVTNGSFTAALN